MAIIIRKFGTYFPWQNIEFPWLPWPRYSSAKSKLLICSKYFEFIIIIIIMIIIIVLLHNAELNSLYSSPNIIRNLKSRRLRWAGHVARWSNLEMHRVLVGKPEAKSPLERPRRRCEDNIIMDLRKVGCDPGDRIALAEVRDQWRAYVRAVMNLRVS